MEALDLYAAEFERKLEAMSDEITRLLTAVEEREELLEGIAAGEMR